MEKVMYSICCIDDDEWGWSVDIMRDKGSVWGMHSECVADGCAYSKQEAVTSVKAELKKLGHTFKTAVRSPF